MVNLKNAFAFFLTVCYRTPAASGLTQEAFMESVINVLIFLAVISLSIYLTYDSKDSSGANKFNDILTFCIHFFNYGNRDFGNQ